MAAARFPDVGARDPHPLVLGRRVEHLAQQLAIVRLELLTLGQSRASPANPLGQRIPHPLKLFQPRDPRFGKATGNLSVDIKPRKGLRAQA